MNKHKLILSFFLFFLRILYTQERNFEKEIQETEKQIQNLQSSIENDNKEISMLQSKEKALINNYLLQKKVLKFKIFN